MALAGLYTLPTLVAGVLAANLAYPFWLHATWLPRVGPPATGLP